MACIYAIRKRRRNAQRLTVILTEASAIALHKRAAPHLKGNDMSDKYILSKNCYYKTIWFIREYNEKKDEYDTIYWSFCAMDGQPRGSEISRPTERRGERAIRLAQELGAVEKALARLPEYYRKPVFENIVDHKRWPNLADPKTYKKYKRQFVYFVAKNMEWI